MIIVTHVSRAPMGLGWVAEASAETGSGMRSATDVKPTRRAASCAAVSSLLTRLEAEGDITQELEVVP